MVTHLDSLKQLIYSVQPFTESEWEAFAALWQPFSAKRKTLLTLPGQVEKHLYFVIDGVQRVYYFDDQGREATLVFTYPPSFGGVLDAMMLQTPSNYYYETLTPSAFLRAQSLEILKLATEMPGVETLLRKGLAGALGGVLERLVEIQCYPAEERFRRLLTRSPHILQLVAHKYLASYLGMDATNFSKLINKVRL